MTDDRTTHDPAGSSASDSYSLGSAFLNATADPVDWAQAFDGVPGALWVLPDVGMEIIPGPLALAGQHAADPIEYFADCPNCLHWSGTETVRGNPTYTVCRHCGWCLTIARENP